MSPSKYEKNCRTLFEKLQVLEDSLKEFQTHLDEFYLFIDKHIFVPVGVPGRSQASLLSTPTPFEIYQAKIHQFASIYANDTNKHMAARLHAFDTEIDECRAGVEKITKSFRNKILAGDLDDEFQGSHGFFTDVFLSEILKLRKWKLFPKNSDSDDAGYMEEWISDIQDLREAIVVKFRDIPSLRTSSLLSQLQL